MTKGEYEARLEALARLEAEALYELEENGFWNDVYAMAAAGIPTPLEPDTSRTKLMRIEWKIRHGRALERWELEFVADGIALHLSDPKASPWDLGAGKRGRPESPLHPVKYWHKVATVHFYRLLLPALDRRKPLAWETLAQMLGKCDRKTLPPLVEIKRPVIVFGLNKNPYDTMMIELVRSERLKGVTYLHGALVGK
ncbi:hypothetical protein D3C79_398320 [compost metagenome]